MEALQSKPAGLPARSRQLYELAKRRNWNASTDIDWGPAATAASWPFDEACSCFFGYARYEALPESQRRRLAWQQHIVEVSELYHGEEAALFACSLILRDLPGGDARRFICTQLFDEARHGEFFFRYLARLGSQPVSVGPRLQQLLQQVRDEEASLEQRLLICQLLIESLAMGRFADLLATSRVALLLQALHRIRQDEARHVHFGIRHLRVLLASRRDSERDELGLEVLRRAFDLATDTEAYVRIGLRQGWPANELRRQLRTHQLRRARLSSVLEHLLRAMRQLELLGPRSRCLLQLRGVRLAGEAGP